MIGFPAPNETAPYYHRYIDRVRTDDVIQVLETQFQEFPRLFGTIPKRYRYTAMLRINGVFVRS